MSAVLALAVVLLCSACSRLPGSSNPPVPVAIVVVRGTEPEGAQLSRDEVLRIATQAFREHGLALSDYTDPEVLYQVAGPQRTWGVYLERRGAAPGNQFGVEIDDQTSEVKFRYGA